MREILFRGKRTEDGKWMYGYYQDEKTSTADFPCIVPFYGSAYDDDNDWEVDVETVGQYTGLKDLHGTRIFEADIVKVYDVYCNETVVGVVEFCDGSFRIYDKDFTSYDRWMNCKVEVIGNVYDDVNLLEGE